MNIYLFVRVENMLECQEKNLNDDLNFLAK